MGMLHLATPLRSRGSSLYHSTGHNLIWRDCFRVRKWGFGLLCWWCSWCEIEWGRDAGVDWFKVVEGLMSGEWVSVQVGNAWEIIWGKMTIRWTKKLVAFAIKSNLPPVGYERYGLRGSRPSASARSFPLMVGVKFSSKFKLALLTLWNNPQIPSIFFFIVFCKLQIHGRR